MKVSIVKISRAIKIKGIKKRKNIYLSSSLSFEISVSNRFVVIVVIVKSSL